jgi:hypothetical protein
LLRLDHFGGTQHPQLKWLPTNPKKQCAKKSATKLFNIAISSDVKNSGVRPPTMIGTSSSFWHIQLSEFAAHFLPSQSGLKRPVALCNSNIQQFYSKDLDHMSSL